MKFNTKMIHSGQRPEVQFGAIIPPIYQTSTFVQQSPGVFKGYDYTRANNPNFVNLEEALASLDNAKEAVVFSSGLAAITALFMIFSPFKKFESFSLYFSLVTMLTSLLPKIIFNVSPFSKSTRL